MASITHSDIIDTKFRAYTLDFSPCGKRLIFPRDRDICVYNTENKEMSCYLRGHADFVWSARYSHDGRHIVSGSHDRTAFIWCVMSGKPVLKLDGHTDGVRSVMFSPDDKRVVSGGFDRDIFIWCAISGQQLQQFKGHYNTVNSVAFCPAGKYIVSGSDDMTVRIWDSTSGRQHSLLRGHKDKVMSAMFSPDGTRIASSSWDKTARVWDVETGQPRLTIKTPYTHVCLSAVFSYSGNYIAIGGGSNTDRGNSTVLICSAHSGQTLIELKGHKDWVCSVIFSPDDKRVASCGEMGDNTIRIFCI